MLKESIKLKKWAWIWSCLIFNLQQIPKTRGYRVKIRVYYEDTDAGGVVYHTNYIKYCERARSELFFERGISPQVSPTEFFVVKNINCDFLKPALLGDILEVKTELIKRKNSSLILKQEVFRDETLLFSALIVLVYVKDLRPSRIPENIVTILDKR